MHYLSIQFHPISTREFARSVSRQLDDCPCFTRADPEFCSETREDVRGRQLSATRDGLLCYWQGNGDRGLGFLSLDASKNSDEIDTEQQRGRKFDPAQDRASSTLRYTRPARVVRVVGLRKDGRDLDQRAGVMATPLDNVKGSREHSRHILTRHLDIVSEKCDKRIPVEAADDGWCYVDLRR